LINLCHGSLFFKVIENIFNFKLPLLQDPLFIQRSQTFSYMRPCLIARENLVPNHHRIVKSLPNP
jgi:hypothetical protein